jgi:hypothetical protein
MTDDQEVWESWLSAFLKVSAAAPDPVKVACPSCGRGQVRVAYAGDPETRIGYSIIWCDACLKGIYLSRVGILEGVAMFTFESSDEEFAATVPNDVQFIQPSLQVSDEENDC